MAHSKKTIRGLSKKLLGGRLKNANPASLYAGSRDWRKNVQAI